LSAPKHAYFSGQSAARDLATRIAECNREVIARVGLNTPEILQYCVERELSRRVAKAALDEIEKNGVSLIGKRLLDLGAGMGQCRLKPRREVRFPLRWNLGKVGET
jgi:hypothetical protein